MNTAADRQTAEAIDAFAPATIEIEAGGKKYTVRRMEVRQIWPVLRAGRPIIEGLAALAVPDSPLGGATTTGQPPGEPAPKRALQTLLGDELTLFFDVMADHGERISEIVATALDIKVSDVGKWEPQELLVAIKAIVGLNRDFFMERVLPLVQQQAGTKRNVLADAVKDALPTIGDGATPSSS